MKKKSINNYTLIILLLSVCFCINYLETVLTLSLKKYCKYFHAISKYNLTNHQTQLTIKFLYT